MFCFSGNPYRGRLHDNIVRDLANKYHSVFHPDAINCGMADRFQYECVKYYLDFRANMTIKTVNNRLIIVTK